MFRTGFEDFCNDSNNSNNFKYNISDILNNCNFLYSGIDISEQRLYSLYI